MNDIDISPEAVDQICTDLGIKSAMINLGERIAWGSETTLMDQADSTLRALSAALITFQQGQTYRYIGKDMKPILARDLEDQRDEALAALTQSRAETAAAYERAAQLFDDGKSVTGAAIGRCIRALAAIPQGEK